MNALREAYQCPKGKRILAKMAGGALIIILACLYPYIARYQETHTYHICPECGRARWELEKRYASLFPFSTTMEGWFIDEKWFLFKNGWSSKRAVDNKIVVSDEYIDNLLAKLQPRQCKHVFVDGGEKRDTWIYWTEGWDWRSGGGTTYGMYEQAAKYHSALRSLAYPDTGVPATKRKGEYARFLEEFKNSIVNELAFLRSRGRIPSSGDSEEVKKLAEKADEYEKKGRTLEYLSVLEKARQLSLQISDAHLTARIHNNLAWPMASSPRPDIRNGKKAVRYARIAVSIMKRGSYYHPGVLAAYQDTLAAAYAETGDFQNAVKAQQEAIASQQKVTGGAKALKNCLARLKLYQSKQPYREISRPISQPVKVK